MKYIQGCNMQDSLPQKKDRREMKQIHSLSKKKITFTKILASDLMFYPLHSKVSSCNAFLLSCFSKLIQWWYYNFKCLECVPNIQTSSPGISMHRKPVNFDACICSKMDRRDNPWTLGLTKKSVNIFLSKPESWLEGRTGHESSPP